MRSEAFFWGASCATRARSKWGHMPALTQFDIENWILDAFEGKFPASKGKLNRGLDLKELFSYSLAAWKKVGAWLLSVEKIGALGVPLEREDMKERVSAEAIAVLLYTRWRVKHGLMAANFDLGKNFTEAMDVEPAPKKRAKPTVKKTAKKKKAAATSSRKKTRKKRH